MSKKRKILIGAALVVLAVFVRYKMTAPENAFDKGCEATKPDDKIAWFTKAISLKPGYEAAYRARGQAYGPMRP